MQEVRSQEPGDQEFRERNKVGTSASGGARLADRLEAYTTLSGVSNVRLGGVRKVA